MKVCSILLVVFTILALTSCGPLQGNGQNEDLVPSDPIVPPEGEVLSMTQTPIDPGIQRMVDLAKEDLALRLSIAIDEIDLIEVKSVVWPDSSLGCPQPGMQYLQVLEDGLLIRLQATGQSHAYHSGGSRPPFLCETVQKDSSELPQIDLFNLTPFITNPDAPTPDNSIPPGENQ